MKASRTLHTIDTHHSFICLCMKRAAHLVSQYLIITFGSHAFVASTTLIARCQKRLKHNFWLYAQLVTYRLKVNMVPVVHTLSDDGTQSQLYWIFMHAYNGTLNGNENDPSPISSTWSKVIKTKYERYEQWIEYSVRHPTASTWL